MGFVAGFSDLTAELASFSFPPFQAVTFLRGLIRPDQPGGPGIDMGISWGTGGLDPTPFAGVVTEVPEMFWTGGIGFDCRPGRFPVLDRFAFPAASIDTAVANLSLAHVLATRHTVTAWAEPGTDPPTTPPGYSLGLWGVVYNDLGDPYAVGYHERYETPTHIPLSLGLYGARWLTATNEWRLYALGGGGSTSYLALNDHEPGQNVVVDAAPFAKTYLANRNNYPVFVWTVVPASGVGFVQSITDEESTAPAIWGMYADGDLTWANVGNDPTLHLPMYYPVGTVTVTDLAWRTAVITGLHGSLGGELSLPAAARYTGYLPPMS